MSELNATSGSAQNSPEISRLREEIADFVRDVSSAGTFDLERESDARLTAFFTALKYVPSDRLSDLVKDLDAYVQSSPDHFSTMDEDTENQLQALKERAGVDL
jgi:hypothetical protein